MAGWLPAFPGAGDPRVTSQQLLHTHLPAGPVPAGIFTGHLSRLHEGPGSRLEPVNYDRLPESCKQDPDD